MLRRTIMITTVAAILTALACSASPPESSSTTAQGLDTIERRVVDGKRVLVALAPGGRETSRLTLTRNGDVTTSVLVMQTEKGRAILKVDANKARGDVVAELTDESGVVTSREATSGDARLDQAFAARVHAFAPEQSKWTVAMKDKANATHFNDMTPPKSLTLGLHPNDLICDLDCEVLGHLFCGEIPIIGLVCDLWWYETVCTPVCTETPAPGGGGGGGCENCE